MELLWFGLGVIAGIAFTAWLLGRAVHPDGRQ
jgi:hypothetical protein